MMTVEELITELKDWDPTMEVRFKVPTHDYWGRELARPVTSLEEVPITRCDYHSADKVDEEAVGTDLKEVLLIQ